MLGNYFGKIYKRLCDIMQMQNHADAIRGNKLQDIVFKCDCNIAQKQICIFAQMYRSIKKQLRKCTMILTIIQ